MSGHLASDTKDAGPTAERHDLFPVPLWINQLDFLAPHLSAMILEAEEFINFCPANASDPYQQSDGFLQRSEDEGWRRFFSFVGDEMQRILRDEMPLKFNISRAYLQSWSLRINGDDDYADHPSVLEVLHSHLPAVLSSVFYLRVPPEMIEAGGGGTLLRDPLAPITRQFRDVGYHIAPVPLRLAIFPSYLEHAPERPAQRMTWSTSRLIVSTDLRVDLG